jgi:hypothetical protein
MIFSFLFSVQVFAAKIEPLRYDPNQITNDRETLKDFTEGQINDVFYNQILYCNLEDLDPGMFHVIAVTLKHGQGRFYEYIDLDSEGRYRLLSKGSVQVTETSDALTILDSAGGHIDFSGAVHKNGKAIVALKDPALTVNAPVSCWREK